MGNCSCSAGSIGGRCALYWGNISMRTRGLPLSKAQMMPSGWKVSTILMNMLKKPKRALVARRPARSWADGSHGTRGA